MAKTTDTLLRELARNIVIKSKVIDVQFSSDNHYKILKLELTSDIKDAIKGIYEDVLFYSFTKNGRVIEG